MPKPVDEVRRAVHGVEYPDEARGVEPGVVLLLAHEAGLGQYLRKAAAHELLHAGVHLGDKIGCVFVVYVPGKGAVGKEQPGLAHRELGLREEGLKIKFLRHGAPPFSKNCGYIIPALRRLSKRK